MDNRPIGIFDSGLGGLTVAKQVFRTLPNESVVYLGDTARVPYGPRSPEIVRKFARQDAYFLAGRNVKYIVIACNTASAHAAADLAHRLAIPVLDVIGPGAAAAVAESATAIGVIGTQGTISSCAYPSAIARLNPNVSVVSRACPLFVPLVEEGAHASPAARLIAEGYLDAFANSPVDTLVLGCTHYPILGDLIHDVVGPNVRLIDPGIATAEALACQLDRRGLLASSDHAPTHHYFVTDRSEKFQELAARFLGAPLCGKVDDVELD